MKNSPFITSAVSILLIFTPMLFAETFVLKYDDGNCEVEDPATGQAVRFTAPSEGFSCKLETLIISVQEYDGTVMTASIWTDKSGQIEQAIGDLLFEQEVTVGTFAEHRIDLSAADIKIPPGGTFFAGWTSQDRLIAKMDISDPNSRTIHRYSGPAWEKVPSWVDAPIRIEYSYVLPGLDSVSPASSARGSRLSLVVDANDAEFTVAGLSTIEDVWLSKGESVIRSTGFIPIDSNSLTASFDIPADADIGKWNLNVESAIFGPMAPLTGAFTIFASPDLNRDGVVDIKDFNLFSKHWQENIVKLPVMVKLTGSAFQMGNHFSGGDADELPLHTVTLDDFCISNFEISNQQYCYFLNSAISKGQIKVESNVVYSSQDTANTYPYFTCNPAMPDSQIKYSNRVFRVESGKSRDMTLDPVVAVSWYGAIEYCNWRSTKEKKEICYDTSTWTCDFSKNGYRLPTEAEWEYAARDSNTDPYLRFTCGLEISHDKANYYASSFYSYDLSGQNPAIYHPDYQSGGEPYTSPTGSFPPSDYGLYDMAGNVWEWCNDYFSETYYSSSEQTNPTGPTAPGNPIRISVRGGSWKSNASFCRTASRNWNFPNAMDKSFGFRVCRRDQANP